MAFQRSAIMNYSSGFSVHIYHIAKQDKLIFTMNYSK